MSFTDVSFMIALALSLAFYAVVPLRRRWLFLLVAGILFYATLDVRFLYVLLVMMAGTYLGCLALATTSRNRLATLWFFIVAIIGWLFVVKWPGTTAIDWFGRPYSIFPGTRSETLMNLTVPIGLSFHALQCVSVLVDTYRRPGKWDSRPGYFALYLCYLPQILAGPIERAPHMYPQFDAPQVKTGDAALEGLELFGRGLFKKLVIADRFGVLLVAYSASIADHRDPLVAATVLCGWATFLFADLSGYTDMARGMSKWFGIHLKKNFDGPYTAKTSSEMWTRWHITLHHFMRDYVYKPLKESNVPIPLCVFAVFFVSGIWHGIGWNFIIWGTLCFAFVMAEAAIVKHLPIYKRAWGGSVRQYMIGSVILIFFFLKTPADAAQMLSSFTEPIDASRTFALLGSLGWQAKDMVVFAVTAVVGFHYFHRPEAEKKPHDVIRWAKLVALAILILILRYPKASLHTYFSF